MERKPAFSIRTEFSVSTDSTMAMACRATGETIFVPEELEVLVSRFLSTEENETRHLSFNLAFDVLERRFVH